MRRTLLIALVCGTPVLAEPREEATLRRTFESLQGQWGVRQMTVAGRATDPTAVQGVRYQFDGDLLVRGDRPEEAVRLQIDVSGRVPKVEFTDRYGVTRVGLIQRSGEAVFMCLVEAGEGPPPTTFRSTRENKAMLIELQPVRR